MDEYYAITTLETLVQALIDAHDDLDMALVRWKRKSRRWRKPGRH